MNTADFSTLLTENPGLISALALCVLPLFVFTWIGFMMKRSGVSLRPIIFMAGLFLPVVVPFAIGQLVIARLPAPVQPSATLAVKDGRLVDRDKLFGRGIAPEFIREAKNGLPGILDEAEVAEVGMTMSGETVLMAQFPNDEATKRAGAAYWSGFQLHNTSGDQANGWRGTRMQGDFVEMLNTGRQLFVWTGLTQEAAAARRAASDLAAQFPMLTPALRAPLFPSLQPLNDFFSQWPTQLIGLVLLVFVYVLWYFKGAGWASSARAMAGTPSVPMDELITRIMAINDLDVPFTITKGAKPHELVADWRYADAKWLDHARAHGMRRTFRIRLTLGESGHTVRATDYTAALDWSAAPSSASMQWQAAMGIVFFQKEQMRVFGLQLNDRGRLKPTLSYSYKFDLNEMKSPLQTAITKSGWDWRPTVWQGPSWLRWLTE